MYKSNRAVQRRVQAEIDRVAVARSSERSGSVDRVKTANTVLTLLGKCLRVVERTASQCLLAADRLALLAVPRKAFAIFVSVRKNSSSHFEEHVTCELAELLSYGNCLILCKMVKWSCLAPRPLWNE